MTRLNVYKKISEVEIPDNIAVDEYYDAVRSALNEDQVDQIGDYVVASGHTDLDGSGEFYTIDGNGVHGPL